MRVTTKLMSILAVLAVALGLVVAGCGDSDDGGGSGERLSVDAYTAELKKILPPLGSGLESSGSAIQSGNDREAIVSGLSDSDSLLSEAIDSLNDLNPPEDAQDGHDQLVSALEGYRDEINDLKGVAEDGSDEELESAGQDFVATSSDFATKIQAAVQALSDAGVNLSGTEPTTG